VEAVSGKYFIKREAESYDETEAQRLWQVSLGLAELTDQEGNR